MIVIIYYSGDTNMNTKDKIIKKQIPTPQLSSEIIVGHFMMDHIHDNIIDMSDVIHEYIKYRGNFACYPMISRVINYLEQHKVFTSSIVGRRKIITVTPKTMEFMKACRVIFEMHHNTK
jgi:predicted transcriptional regulator